MWKNKAASSCTFQTYPASMGTLSLHRRLMSKLAMQDRFDTGRNRRLRWLFVHLSTRYMSFKLYQSKFRVITKSIISSCGTIKLRIIKPEYKGRLPVVLYFHGGEELFANSKSYERVIKNISHYSRAVVVCVDYHRIPEYIFPAPLKDYFSVLMWVYKHARDLGVNPCKIALAGDGTGAALAASLAIYNRDKEGPALAKQVLINPRTGLATDTAYLQQFVHGYGAGLYHLPPVYIITSEHDPLRNEGEELAAAMKNAGTEVNLIRYLGVAHIMAIFGSTRETARHAFEQIGAELKRSFTMSS